MNRLPTEVASYLYSFLPLTENIALASTSAQLRNTSLIPTSSPRKVAWKSFKNTKIVSSNPTRIVKNKNGDADKQVSSWRMWPTTVYANNLEYDILPWFTTYPAAPSKIRASLLTHLALKINSAEQTSELLIPALKMLLGDNDRKDGDERILIDNTTLKSLLIWNNLTAESDESDENYSSRLRQQNLILPLLKKFTGLTTLGVSGLSVTIVTHFPPSLTHVFLDTAPKLGDGTNMEGILAGWKSLSQLPLQKLSLYLPRHQDYPNCAGENCYSGTAKLAERAENVERTKPADLDGDDKDANNCGSRQQKFVWQKCDECKLSAETNLYTLPSSSPYLSGAPVPPRNWTFDNNLANSLALHFSKQIDNSANGLIIEAYELNMCITAPPQIPRMTEFDCRVTSPTSLNYLMTRSGRQLRKLRIRGVRLKDSFVNFDAFDDATTMNWARYCNQLTELIFTGQAVNDRAVTQLFRWLTTTKSLAYTQMQLPYQPPLPPLLVLDLSGNDFVGLGEKQSPSNAATSANFVQDALSGLTSLRIVSQFKAGKSEFLNAHQFSELRIPTLIELELRTGSELLPAGFETFDSILDAFPNLTIWRAPRIVSLSTKFFTETQTTTRPSSSTSTSSTAPTSIAASSLQHPLNHLDLGLVGKISLEQMAEIVKFINRRLPLLVRLTVPTAVEIVETLLPTNQNGERILVVRKSPLVKRKY